MVVGEAGTCRGFEELGAADSLFGSATPHAARPLARTAVNGAEKTSFVVLNIIYGFSHTFMAGGDKT